MEKSWRSAETVEFVDLDGVVQYTLLLDNATAATKVGFFLEQHKEPLMMENAHFEPLRARRLHQPRYPDRNRRGGRLDTGWNLIAPSGGDRVSPRSA